LQIFCWFGSNLRDKTWSPILFEPSIDKFSWELLENCYNLQIFCWFGSNLRDKTWSPILFEPSIDKFSWELLEICHNLQIFFLFWLKFYRDI
jgi:hypothetical protein